MYCAALRWSKPYQVRRGRNTKCSSPVFYQHVVQTTISLFLPLLNNRFLAWLIPCMVRVSVLQPRFGSCSLMKLIKTRECNILQSAGVWGKTPFSTGDSSQFCRIHYIPESVELCKQLSGPRGIAKPENNLWKFVGQFEKNWMWNSINSEKKV